MAIYLGHCCSKFLTQRAARETILEAAGCTRPKCIWTLFTVLL